jgi:hypothetical protein
MKMKRLKYLCLLGTLLLIAAALTGIQSVSTGSSGTTITKFNGFGRIWCLAGASVLAAFAYGIHIRARMTWKAGFILLALGYINSVAGVVTAIYHAPQAKDVPSTLLFVGLVVLLGAAVAFYWGLWWNRQRSYFPQ